MYSKTQIMQSELLNEYKAVHTKIIILGPIPIPRELLLKLTMFLLDNIYFL